MVSPAKQIWKDFSSGKGGNVVAFLMEHEHFSYPEAIKYLAKKYNIEVEETEQSDEQKQAATARESMYLVTDFAQSYFSDILLNSDEGKAIGLSYFKERGFTSDSIAAFSLGYAPDRWEAFTQAALDAGFQEEFLIGTGLTIAKDKKRFDRFKGRVIFPIQSMSGRVMGFGGRILTQDKNAAKYLNSPESEIYHKSKVLYGLYQAKQSIAKEDNCYLVEGYTDVIQLYQTGVKNVVSSSGTALTSDQIRLIRRLTPNITLLFDGDPAGLRAALRGVDLILEAGMNVKVCMFPEGEDPDSFARKTDFETLSLYLEEQAQDFIQFKATLLAEEGKKDPIRKAETIREMVQSIAKIPDPIKREVYVQNCSLLMEISEDVLFSTLAQISKNPSKPVARKAPKPAMEVVNTPVQKVDVRYELERNIIALLLLHGQEEVDINDVVIDTQTEEDLTFKTTTLRAKVYEKIYLDLQQDEVALSTPSFRDLYEQLLVRFNTQQPLVLESFIRDLSPEQSSLVTNILMQDESNALHDWARKEIYVKEKTTEIGRWLTQTILNFRCHLIQEKIGSLQQQTVDSQDQTHAEVLEEVKAYIGLRKNLSERLDRVLF